MVKPANKEPRMEPTSAVLMNSLGRSPVLLVCEHASNSIPPRYGDLGLTPEARASHAAWDPGALELAMHMSRRLDARLVAGTVSRLVYDCNRPPQSSDAMLAVSEMVQIPGNAGLSEAEKKERIATVYEPFKRTLDDEIAAAEISPVLVTVHSFTPVYKNVKREVEYGILHDDDARLADAMLEAAAECSHLRVMRNQPYGPKDGVTHTLKQHGMRNGLLNVMLEIASNLIDTPSGQRAIADLSCDWLLQALEQLGATTVAENVQCRV